MEKRPIRRITYRPEKKIRNICKDRLDFDVLRYQRIFLCLYMISIGLLVHLKFYSSSLVIRARQCLAEALFGCTHSSTENKKSMVRVSASESMSPCNGSGRRKLWFTGTVKSHTSAKFNSFFVKKFIGVVKGRFRDSFMVKSNSTVHHTVIRSLQPQTTKYANIFWRRLTLYFDYNHFQLYNPNYS